MAEAPGPVVIAAVTYKRNEDLAMPLPLLTAETASITPSASILLVDNDPAGGAAEAVSGSGAQYRREQTPAAPPRATPRRPRPRPPDVAVWS